MSDQMWRARTTLQAARLNKVLKLEVSNRGIPTKCACGCEEFKNRKDGFQCVNCKANYSMREILIAGGGEQ